MPPPPSAAAAKASVGQRCCAHNHWDNVRVVKGNMMLRCRVCQKQWRCSTGALFRCRCRHFAGGGCRMGDRCPDLHIYARKLSLGERIVQHGDAGGILAYHPAPTSRAPVRIVPAGPRSAGQAPGEPTGAAAASPPPPRSTTSPPPPPAAAAAPEEEAAEPEVAELLAALRLDQFCDALMHEGYEDIATLREVGDDELAAMGMGGGHVKRLRKALSNGAPAAPALAPAAGARASPPAPAAVAGTEVGQERCVDAADGCAYTKQEFLSEYGGTAEWDTSQVASDPRGEGARRQLVHLAFVGLREVVSEEVEAWAAIGQAVWAGRPAAAGPRDEDWM